MKTKKIFIAGPDGHPISSSKALIWGNNAAWLCTDCGELLGNRTGENEYRVECTNEPCPGTYEIVRKPNKSGKMHLGPATGVRKVY